MSFTVSRGLTDAGRWTAVATALVEYLETIERTSKRKGAAPEPPAGAIAAALQFFTFVLEGIALDRKSPRCETTVGVSSLGSAASYPSPAMAGTSNLSIAVNVMRGSRGPATNLKKVEKQITSLRQTLERLQVAGAAPLRETERTSLVKFLRGLQHQGEVERDATFAAQERPRAYAGRLA